MKTPVVLFLFNRPEKIEQLLAAVAVAQPETLFLIADGPRPDHPADLDLCAQAREVALNITWPCLLYTAFAEANLGCGVRIASGIDLVFSEVEEAIFLEDDCIPSPDFFVFCEELLEKYRNDTRIGIISGNNFLPPEYNERIQSSYYFSRYPHTWGWASWRRTWRHFDFFMRHLPEALQTGVFEDMFERPEVVEHWSYIVSTLHGHPRADIWDYQFLFACQINSFLSVVPTVNLVSNVGFGPEALHTTILDSPLANRPVGQISVPLRHPNFIVRSRVADDYTEKNVFHIPY